MITGGVKFFEPSQCLEKDGAQASASSGDATAAFVIDRNPDTKWRSAGSDDTVTETLTIEFSGNKAISRLLVTDHNWKDYNIKYDVAGVWTHFANVRGLNGTMANITETVFADDSSYYEFDQVTTSKIQIQVLKTQVADQEKYAAQVIATRELGTFMGYPEVKDVQFDKNSRNVKTQSGRYSIQKSDETVSFDFTFKSYPTAALYNVDMDLALSLFDREDPFLVWLCGGRRGTNYFRYTLRGYRLRDVFLMQVSKAVKLGYVENVYVNPLNAKFELEESI